jgi:hypothetical protein
VHRDIHQGATVHLILDVVRETGPATEIFELVVVHPTAQWAFDLLIHKQSIPFVIAVPRYPPERPALYHHAGADLDAAGTRDLDRRKRRREQRQRLLPLVEPKHNRDRRIDYDALAEDGQAPRMVSQ